MFINNTHRYNKLLSITVAADKERNFRNNQFKSLNWHYFEKKAVFCHKSAIFLVYLAIFYYIFNFL